nr:MAG TPA: hypothetical protein [Caudoviricetes sp.]
MITAKQYKSFETYRRRVGLWSRNVKQGKEKKTDALESRQKDLKKFLTKSGVIRKNLSKAETAELSEIVKKYKKSRWSSQKKRKETYKNINKKTVETLSQHAAFESYSKRTRKEIAERAFSIFDYMNRDNNTFSFLYLDSGQVLDLAENTQGITLKDFEKLVLYVRDDRLKKRPTFLERTQFIDDDFSAIESLLNIVYELENGNVDDLLLDLKKVEENYTTYAERVKTSKSKDKLGDFIKELQQDMEKVD